MPRPASRASLAFTAFPSKSLSVTQRARAELGRTEPFRSAEEAWFWTMSALTARREGVRNTTSQGKVKRPCDPDDVVRCLDALYRSKRIDLMHARILRVWGERGHVPDPRYASERSDHRVWREALERLEGSLRVKGIVA